MEHDGDFLRGDHGCDPRPRAHPSSFFIQCNFERQADGNESPIALEWLLLVVHLGLLIAAEFGSNRLVSSYYGDGLVLLLLPAAAVTAGRWWPFFVLFPVTATPILGKTLRQLVYRDATMDRWTGWAVYAILPMLLLLALATYFALATKKPNQTERFLATSLLATTWLYFGLNFAFFRFPLPWQEWSGRTPSAILFSIATISLTLLSIWPANASRRMSSDRLQ